MSNQELTSLHHDIVDSLMDIVANLFLIEQINQYGCKLFIHNGIKLQINKELVIFGLRMDLKQGLISELGEQAGLNQSYSVLTSMYIESEDKPIALSPMGRFMLEQLFIGVIEDIQAKSPVTTH